MKVKVIETGPDGVVSIVWNTEKLREHSLYLDWNDELVDLRVFADALEKDTLDEKFMGYKYAASYNLSDLEGEYSYDGSYDKEHVMYCED